MAADACLALGRLATDPNLSMVAMKKGAEIASIAVSRYFYLIFTCFLVAYICL